jgi:hypothetical protein
MLGVIHSVPYMFSMSFANLSLKAQCQLTAKSEFYFYSSRSGDGKVCFNSLSYYSPSLLFYLHLLMQDKDVVSPGHSCQWRLYCTSYESAVQVTHSQMGKLSSLTTPLRTRQKPCCKLLACLMAFGSLHGMLLCTYTIALHLYTEVAYTL